ncbi:heterokaryon incompatibility protein-domain-containing protein [Phaeosphaeriaceae sp. PMI808]|nr:heterokaryon incompatibility protein-domain-containing protein [Phaeosphaeriaceae sp. PMI808]
MENKWSFTKRRDGLLFCAWWCSGCEAAANASVLGGVAVRCEAIANAGVLGGVVVAVTANTSVLGGVGRRRRPNAGVLGGIGGKLTCEYWDARLLLILCEAAANASVPGGVELCGGVGPSKLTYEYYNARMLLMLVWCRTCKATANANVSGGIAGVWCRTCEAAANAGVPGGVVAAANASVPGVAVKHNRNEEFWNRWDVAANASVLGGIAVWCSLYEAAANAGVLGGVAVSGGVGLLSGGVGPVSGGVEPGAGLGRKLTCEYWDARLLLMLGVMEGLPLRALSATVHSCPCCSAIVDEPHTDATYNASLSDIRTSAESCSICKLLLRAFQHCRNDDGNIDIKRIRSALGVGAGGPRILRFCTEPGYAVGTDPSTPIGRPILPESDNPARFALLRAWLHQCDKSHDCNKHQGESKTALPTRVLYVGDPKDSGYASDFVRLVCTSEASRREYVALSHCWGDLSVEEKKAYCTTQDNISQRSAGFSLSELPKTFRDAVKVTRELGILYLWIDSLCIIQYGDNGEDWKSESGRMESVFSAAYCTIAATMAIDSFAGFLQRDISPEYVYVQDPLGKQFYISTDIDDFDNDVGKAQLNTRAWVMQEGVLARRTIHFSANQTYWECGEGVYCENLTRLESHLRGKYFMLDSNFPSRLLKSGKRRTLNYISFLFQDYSERNLTVPTDKFVAISGLVNRIAGALECQSRYGIFQKYLHRNLLWQASDDKMKEIAYDHHVPSWSWMAYSGGIQFMDIPLGDVDWFDHLRFDEECECDHAIISNLWTFQNCTMELNKAQYAVLDSDGTHRGWIQYDIEGGKDLRKEHCVVVGRRSNDGIKEYYVLVVRPTSVNGEYRRVGAGLIESDFVVGQRINVRVV